MFLSFLFFIRYNTNWLDDFIETQKYNAKNSF